MLTMQRKSKGILYGRELTGKKDISQQRLTVHQRSIYAIPDG